MSIQGNSIALATEIQFDAFDLLGYNLEFDDKDSMECSQCGEEHSTRKWYKEMLQNIIDNATALEGRLKDVSS